MQIAPDRRAANMASYERRALPTSGGEGRYLAGAAVGASIGMLVFLITSPGKPPARLLRARCLAPPEAAGRSAVLSLGNQPR